MAAPEKTRGTTFSRDNGTTYDVIGEVVAVTPPAVTRSAIETTNLNPTNDFRTYIAGVKDGGEISLTLNWDTAMSTDAENQALLYGDITDADAAVNYRIVFANSDYVTVSGILTAFTPSAEVIDGKREAAVTIKVTGKPAYTEV